jgi:hypothetical protein
MTSAAEYFKMCQAGTDALLCWGIVLKVLICESNEGATFNIVITSHLIFMAKGTLLIDHLPY